MLRVSRQVLLPASARELLTLARRLAVCTLAVGLWHCARAQWTVVNLHPAGATESRADGVSGGHQVGSAYFGGHYHASLWSGTAASWVDLGAADSSAYGVSGGQQVGEVGWHASLWSGTAASRVDLHPTGASYSWAYAQSAGQQVGRAYLGDYDHASLWSGTASSWVDLHPGGATRSVAFGVSGGQQVGFANFGGYYHAGLWSGTAASWVDLHPGGFWRYSFAYGVSGGQQVGSVRNAFYHACLWSGTAASWVDLNPAWASESEAYSVSGGQQVGYANSGNDRASLWSGTAASWVDLHSFVPAGFSSSKARGIWHSGNATYVVGSGYNTITGREEALLWKRGSSGPTATVLEAQMVAWNKLRVKVEGTWPGATGSYRVRFTINGKPVVKTSSATTFEFKLDELGVPRFSGPQRFNVYVDPVLNGVIGTPSPAYPVSIPLPVIIVQGITTDIPSQYRPEALISHLTANGYRTDGPTDNDYPTVHLLDTNAGYLPSFELLEPNATQLALAVDEITSPLKLKTYASRVDIVSHSKGGLVSRMFLKRHDPSGSKVRRLIMACSPHTGSAEATTWVSVILNKDVLRELAPVDPWKRAYPLLPFLIPSEWANPELTELNQTPIDPATQTYLFHGTTFQTKANYTGGLGAAWGSIDGDGWVTKLSQRGFTILNLQNGTVTAGPRIPAFSVTPIEVGLALGHQGYLNNAKTQVLWALTR